MGSSSKNDSLALYTNSLTYHHLRPFLKNKFLEEEFTFIDILYVGLNKIVS